MKKKSGFYYRLIRATFARRTLFRFLQNEILINESIQGKVLDLGGNNKSQYYQYLKIEKNTIVDYADLYDESNNVINMDFTKPFPIESKKYDNVILMNVIEHLDNYEICLKEVKRILKNDGYLTGIVPFLFPIHMVPDDFHRPTESYLYEQLYKAGFNEIIITHIGYGRWTAAANLCGQKIKIKPLALILYFSAFLLDKIDSRKNKYSKEKFVFPLGYFFKAR